MISRLYILDYGLFQVHSNGRIIGIMGYLLQTALGENILIDTGFPAKYAENIERATIEDRLDEFGRVVSLTADNLPAGQLAKIGLSTNDIDLLIMSHTHIDHVGGLNDFPHAPMVISAAERALPSPLYWGDVRPYDWPSGIEYRLINADTTLMPGLDILLTPGHAPGQLSFLITLPETGPVLLTSDAISRPAEIEERFDTARDPQAAVASAEKLMSIAREEEALIIYGHDPAQWNTLKKAPKWYA
ncbi:MAG: N-acyl homoserine lactonase family protein [Chloroflexota bacterium]